MIDLMNQKGISVLIAVLIGLVILAVIFFSPMPYYQENPVLCKAPGCPAKTGWLLGPSLWDKLRFQLSITRGESYEESHIQTPKPSASPDETANWKNFENTSLGFKLRYPQEFSVWGETKEKVVISGDYFGQLTISKNNFVDYKKIKLCSKIDTKLPESENYPCMEGGSLRKTKLDNIDALNSMVIELLSMDISMLFKLQESH